MATLGMDSGIIILMLPISFEVNQRTRMWIGHVTLM